MNHGMTLFTNMKSYPFIKCKTIPTLKVVSTETYWILAVSFIFV